jgi:hypothetical protein
MTQIILFVEMLKFCEWQSPFEELLEFNKVIIQLITSSIENFSIAFQDAQHQ